LPTAILKNLPAYVACVDGVRVEDSELKKLITRSACGIGAARSIVRGRGVHHLHCFLRAPPPRDAPHVAHYH
jgi:hypothetical protein